MPHGWEIEIVDNSTGSLWPDKIRRFEGFIYTLHEVRGIRTRMERHILGKDADADEEMMRCGKFLSHCGGVIIPVSGQGRVMCSLCREETWSALVDSRGLL